MAESSHRVLVIDDEPAICELVAEVAESIGFEVRSASTPDEIEVALEWRCDLVVLDLSLGEIDGIEVMSRLGARRRGLPVILVSGVDRSLLVSAGKVAEMHRLRVLGTFAKPFALDAQAVVERSDPLHLQVDGCRGQTAHVVEIAEHRAFGDSRPVGDPSRRRMDLAALVEIEECRDDGRLVALAASTTSIGGRRGHEPNLIRTIGTADHGVTMRAVTIPNMPWGPSAWLRMWQCQAHTPGSVPLYRTV